MEKIIDIVRNEIVRLKSQGVTIDISDTDKQGWLNRVCTALMALELIDILEQKEFARKAEEDDND